MYAEQMLAELLEALRDGTPINLIVVAQPEFSPAETEQIVQDRLSVQLHNYLKPSLN